MKRIYLLILLMFSACSPEQIPEVNPYADCSPEILVTEQSAAIEGCIISDHFNFDPSTGRMELITRKSNIGIGKDRLWPLAIIPYYFHPGTVMEDGTVIDNAHDKESREHIREILAKDSELTGFIYKEYPTQEALQKDYNYGVTIAKSVFNNSSYLGRRGGIQVLFLVDIPNEQGALHDIGHLKGKVHVFQRWDRDDHIIIHYDNIHEKYWSQFEKKGRACGDYPEWTIMDYPWNAYAIDPEKPTKTNLDGEIMEMPGTLTEVDIQTDRALYAGEFEKR